MKSSEANQCQSVFFTKMTDVVQISFRCKNLRSTKQFSCYDIAAIVDCAFLCTYGNRKYGKIYTRRVTFNDIHNIQSCVFVTTFKGREKARFRFYLCLLVFIKIWICTNIHSPITIQLLRQLRKGFHTKGIFTRHWYSQWIIFPGSTPSIHPK